MEHEICQSFQFKTTFPYRNARPCIRLVHELRTALKDLLPDTPFRVFGIHERIEAVMEATKFEAMVNAMNVQVVFLQPLEDQVVNKVQEMGLSMLWKLHNP